MQRDEDIPAGRNPSQSMTNDGLLGQEFEKLGIKPGELSFRHLQEEDLIELVNSCRKIRTTMFAFISCLRGKEDQTEFIRRWVKSCRRRIMLCDGRSPSGVKYMILRYDNSRGIEATVVLLSSGRIELYDWEMVMNSCHFIHKYCVCRKAYWGENAGRVKVGDKTNLDALIRVFGPTKGQRVNMMVDDNYIWEIKPGDLNPSNWANEEAGFLWSNHLAKVKNVN
jgi:hypothetical protein